MTAKELISEMVAPLRPGNSCSDALGMMDELRVSHLPVVEGNDYLGLISDTEIYSRGEFDLPVRDERSQLKMPFVYEHQHLFDVLVLMAEQKLSLLPVISSRSQYVGVISGNELMQRLPAIFSLDQPGGIISLEVNRTDYLLTEIAGIVESNDARVMGVFLSSKPDSTRMEVTIRVNVTDIGAILQTFSRYNYLVSASWSKEDSFSDGLQDRYDSLMNYLNI